MKALYITTDCVELDEEQKKHQREYNKNRLTRILKEAKGYEHFESQNGKWNFIVAYEHDKSFRKAFSGQKDYDIVFINTCFFNEGDNEDIENLIIELKQSKNVPIFLIEQNSMFPVKSMYKRRVINERIADGYINEDYGNPILDTELDGWGDRFYEGFESYLQNMKE